MILLTSVVQGHDDYDEGEWRSESAEKSSTNVSSDGMSTVWFFIVFAAVVGFTILIASVIAIISWLYYEYRRLVGYVSLTNFAISIVRSIITRWITTTSSSWITVWESNFKHIWTWFTTTQRITSTLAGSAIYRLISTYGIT